MNAKKLILTSAIALGSLMGYAQAQEVIEYQSNPHFYLQGQVGAQETLGEGSFGKLLSAPTVQLGVGYQINPLFGLRVSANFLSKGKGAIDFRNKTEYWKWNHLAAMLDGTFNLTNAIGGYNPERRWDLNLLAGVGANICNGNDEAENLYNTIIFADGSRGILENLWTGSKTWFTGRVGLALDYKINSNVAVGVEVSANCLTDKYNSKKASNLDWYFNGLVGVKYCFGTTYTKRVIPVAPVKEIVKETIVVHDTVVVAPQPVVEFVETATAAPAAVETMTRNVFYRINSSKINSQEMAKVAEIADYLKSHPDANVHITGYADKGTGTLAINLRLARERAAAVVTALTKTYGISASRITSSSMTNHEFQPFEDPVLNRVAICVVE